ncbi:hypothetical protein MalM25_09770 [Planctomycetes bacterium MalM25]|nr:hypothetical protein MalM25_09770 [Planctomycetes bacterium MalM25]
MTFTFPTLAIAGVALAGLPIVIHLLNLRRRRVVPWAAMDFLLQSDRKNRTWVRLSEWLLLAARVLAIAAVGVLAATPLTADLLGDLFGGEPTHHFVLLDDTCSMQRGGSNTTAWDEATAALQRLADRAEANRDTVTVVRYTDPRTGAPPAPIAGGDPGLQSDPVSWNATDATIDAPQRLAEFNARVASAETASKLAYVFSDFASRDHADREAWSGAVRSLSATADEAVLVACGEPASGNLAISRLALAPGPLAAGVETRLEIEVVNHADEPAPPVALTLHRNGRPLTAIEVGPFEPGGRRAVEAPISWAGVGLHVVEASLPADRLTADNHRWIAVEAPAAQKVLLVDDSEAGVEARVFAAALRPLGRTRSGWAPERASDLSEEALQDAAAVFVLDVERLVSADVRRLREYVVQGGGLLMACGPRTDPKWFNRAIAGGGLGGAKPLAPWRLGPPVSAPPPPAGESMLTVAEHPVVRVFAGDQNGFLSLVRTAVRRRLRQDDSPRLRKVSTDPEPGYETLVAYADGKPLLMESRYGEGRVIGLLTTAATGAEGAEPWSNLATLPVFPVLANDLAGWLAQGRLEPPRETIGDPVAKESTSRATLRRWDDSGDFLVSPGLGERAPLAPPTPGVYRRTLAGVSDAPFDAAVAASESDLASPTLSALQTRWNGVARVGRARDLFREEAAPSSRVPLHLAAATLLALLALERWLAYRNSYVSAAAPRAGEGRR